MNEKFTVEIISPDRTILKQETNEVTIPSYEGQMGILKNHIPLITFLRPGFIVIKSDKEEKEEKYYVEEGSVEFSRNNLLILSSTVRDMNKFNKSSISELIIDAEKKFKDNNLTDKEKFLVSYKIDALKEISQ